MRLLRKGILLAGVVISLLPCPVFGGEKSVAEINKFRQTFARVDQDGEVWVAYYDPESGLHIRNAESGKDFLLNPGEGKAVSSGLAFDIRKGHLFAAWREKTKGKRLFFRASHDNGKTLSEPVLLDDGKTQPLTRLAMDSNTKGDVAVAWYGETKIEDNKDHLYAACSGDFGNTFSKPQNLTPGYGHSIYPTVLVDDKGTYVFSYSTAPRNRGSKRYMVFRKSVDGCKTWSDPLEIKEIGSGSLFVRPMRIGNRLHVVWFNSYDGNRVIEGAYSDDEGSTWKTTVLESTRGFDPGVMRFANDSRGHIYIAMHGKKSTEGKVTVYLVRSEDNGATWSEMIPMRHYSSKETQAENLLLRAEDDGTVVAVWMDYRNIRGNLYMQYSRDYGKTWQEKDTPIEEPGRFNTGFFPYTADIVRAKDRYSVPAYRFKGDLTMSDTADLFLLDFTLDKGDKAK